MKPYIKASSNTCLKRGLTEIFSLTNPDGNNCNHIASQWAQLRSTLTCPPPPKWVWKRRFISGFQREMCSSWEMSVFQLLVIQNSLWPRSRVETLLLGAATLAWWNAPVVHLAHPVPTWYVRGPSRPFWDWAVRATRNYFYTTLLETCWFILRLSFDVQGS